MFRFCQILKLNIRKNAGISPSIFSVNCSSSVSTMRQRIVKTQLCNEFVHGPIVHTYKLRTRNFMWTENVLKTELFESDGVAIIK